MDHIFNQDVGTIVFKYLEPSPSDVCTSHDVAFMHSMFRPGCTWECVGAAYAGEVEMFKDLLEQKHVDIDVVLSFLYYRIDESKDEYPYISKKCRNYLNVFEAMVQSERVDSKLWGTGFIFNNIAIVCLLCEANVEVAEILLRSCRIRTDKSIQRELVFEAHFRDQNFSYYSASRNWVGLMGKFVSEAELDEWGDEYGRLYVY